VRYSWLSRSTSHGTCDSTINCDPEADLWSVSLAGGTVRTTARHTLSLTRRDSVFAPSSFGACDVPQGANRVGTYVDPSPDCASLAFTVCEVIEGLTGYVKLVRVGTRCSSSDYFVLPNSLLHLDDVTLRTDSYLTVADTDIGFTPIASVAESDT
jgi:hypothetical protein